MPLAPDNSVEFKLISNTIGVKDIEDHPKSDEGIGNIYERDKDSKGFLKTRSNDITIYGSGYDLALRQFASKGILEDFKLQKRYKNELRVDERWENEEPIFLDLGEGVFDDDERTFKTKAIEGGVYKIIDDAKDKEFDLTDTENLLGESMDALNIINVELNPKDIELISKGSVEEGREISAVVSGGDNLNARAVPFKWEVNSDKDNIKDAIGSGLNAVSNRYASLASGNVANILISNAKTDKRIKLNGKVKSTVIVGNPGTATLDIVIYNEGIDYIFERKIELDNISTFEGAFLEYNFDDYELFLNEGESMVIGMLSDTFDGIRWSITGTEMTITEDSGEFFPSTYHRAITEFELGKRLIEKITGQKDSFACSFLDKGGEHEGKILSSGFWVRGFPDIVDENEEDERRIPFNTSLDDFLKHLDARNPIAYWTETINNKEVFRVEYLSYTQQNNVSIKYGETNSSFQYVQVSGVKRTNLKDNFYGTLEFGFEKGGDDYEEVSGLQAISGKASYYTINPNDSVYSKVSPYRGDDTGIEFLRRKPFENFPDTDADGDSDICSIDCKVANGVYIVKKWQDFYEKAPTGIYSVDTSYNLESTPTRFLLNHSAVINVGLYQHVNKFIRGYASNCNGSYSSKKVNQIEIREDSPIPHNILEKPRVRPVTHDFEMVVDRELEKTITGVTNGVPNWFGIAAVQKRTGIEYFRIIKVDVNGRGTHKLIEAFI